MTLNKEEISIGDILIKVDTRAHHSVEFNTQHHAMLVVKAPKRDGLIVAHMKFTNFVEYTGRLVVERISASKHLILIQCPTFSTHLRTTIAALAMAAYENDKLRIDQKNLEHEYKIANQFRWDDRYDKKNKLQLLHQQPINIANIMPDTLTFISCHNFVVSTIQHACRALNEPIPAGLHFAPQLAWSDILHATCREDSTLNVCQINTISLARPDEICFFTSTYKEVLSEEKTQPPFCVIL